MSVERAKNVPPFVLWCTAMIPTAFDDSMSYYEALCALYKFIQDNLVEPINNNATVLDKTVKDMAELKSYVDNYFENLDVQEEINNKLDEMAEGGQLAAIIAQFLAVMPVFGYDTVADMVAAENLTAGQKAKTSGFYAVNDKGGAEYVIRAAESDETADGMFTILMNNGLIAELVVPNKLFVDQLGAYGDGVHDDATVIQAAIEKMPMGTLYFSDKTYGLGSTVKTYIDKTKITNLILSNNTIVKALTSLDALFELGGLGGSNDGVDKRDYWFEGGKLDGTNCYSAIKINPQLMCQNLENVEINYASIGVYMPKDENNYPSDLKMDGCVINGRGSQNSTVGVYCERTDNKFLNSRINACTKAFYFEGGGQTIINVHALGIGGGSWWNDSMFVHFHSGGGNMIQSSYCDTLKTFVKNDTNGDFTLSGCVYYSYMSNVDCALFKIDGDQFSRFTITGNTFDMPVAATKHQGLVFAHYGDGSSVNPQTVHIENNLIRRSDSFVHGDFLLKVNNYTPYWFNSGTSLSTTQWLKIGYVPASVIYNRLAINIGGWLYRVNYKIERYGSTIYLTQRTSSTEATGTPIKIGFKYENNTNGVPVFGVYVQQNTGTALPCDITIIPEIENVPFMPIAFEIKTPSLETADMDASMNIS